MNAESFEFVRKDDIIYGVHIDSFYTMINMLDAKYTPVIGRFIVEDVQHITSEKRNIADRYDEPEYVDSPCNIKKITIKPLDKNASKILKRESNLNLAPYGSIYKDHAIIKLGFSCNGSSTPMRCTQGRGTTLCLFLTEDDVKKYAYDFINSRTNEDELKLIKHSIQYNKKQLKKLV